jgi:RNA polymerase sigma factor (sigma-70 family)
MTTESTTTSKFANFATRFNKRMSKETEREFSRIASELERFFIELLHEYRQLIISVYDNTHTHYNPGVEVPEQEIPYIQGLGEPIDFHTSTTFQSVISPKIVSLLAKLQGISYKMVFHGLDPEDTLQSICLALLERAAKEPEFASQEDAYICQYAKWSAWHLLQHSNIYNDYVEGEKWTADEEYNEISEFEYIPCEDPEPEEMFERYEAERMLALTVKDLAPENRTVVKMLYVGYSRAEIATKLHISRPAVTQRIKTIRKALRPVCKYYLMAQYADR